MFIISNLAKNYIYNLCLTKNNFYLKFDFKINNNNKFNFLFLNENNIINLLNIFNDKFFIYIDKFNFKYINSFKLDLITYNNFKNELVLNIDKTFVKSKKINNSYLKKVILFVKKNINPYLNLHNGGINIKYITKELFLVIEFTGNCNKCSFKKNTIKNFIFKKINKEFPEILDIKYF